MKKKVKVPNRLELLGKMAEKGGDTSKPAKEKMIGRGEKKKNKRTRKKARKREEEDR